MATLQSLPVELHFRILSFLSDLEDQLCTSHTCQLWRDITSHRPFLKARYEPEAACGTGVHAFINGYWPHPPLGCTVLNGEITGYTFCFRPWEKRRGQKSRHVVRKFSTIDEDISRCEFLDDPCFIALDIRDDGDGAAAKQAIKDGLVPPSSSEPNIRVVARILKDLGDSDGGNKLQSLWGTVEGSGTISVNRETTTVRQLVEDTVKKLRPTMRCKLDSETLRALSLVNSNQWNVETTYHLD
ncbi:hypothetical protein ABW20_dc0102265 [Dactylellina cionopaga]|nr:hypothetical protein ABW20_dc0102265 [Dactylellina cionopaga]